MARKKPARNTQASPGPVIDLIEAFFIANPFKAFNYRQVSKLLGITDNISKALVNKALESMTKKGTILELNRGKFKYNPDLLADKILQSSVIGIVDMKQTGKAYVTVPDLDEDVFIAANNAGHALNGDKVKVHLFPMRRGRKTEGQIVEVLVRARTTFVGTVQLTGKFAFLVPDDTSVPVDIFIPKESLNKAKNGQKAIARLTDWPEQSKNPFGEISQVLGDPGNNDVEMNSILATFDFPLQFNDQTMKEAENLPVEISEREIASRRDFRNIWTCTIDPPDAKDFDDALSLKKLDNGEWEVGVHIADVSHYVRPHTAIDHEAYERGTDKIERAVRANNTSITFRGDISKVIYQTTRHR